MYVVVAYSRATDTSAVVGPYRSHDWAIAASQVLIAKGYHTEVCSVSNVDDLPPAVQLEFVPGDMAD